MSEGSVLPSPPKPISRYPAFMPWPEAAKTVIDLYRFGRETGSGDQTYSELFKLNKGEGSPTTCNYRRFNSLGIKRCRAATPASFVKGQQVLIKSLFLYHYDIHL
jgi:hypothetical protein